MATRKEVYAVLDEEREYQQKVWGDVDDKNKPKNYIKYIKAYLTHASDALKLEKLDVAMDAMRKVGALSVVCMENFGAVRRGQTSDPSVVAKTPLDKPEV